MRVHEDELEIDEPLVRALLREQFPEWAELPLARVEPEGTVNVIYRLGADMSVRLPRVDWAADDEHQREHLILPAVAPWLAVEVPRVVARGGPGARFPWGWSVFGWIEGDLPDGPLPVEDVAAFVTALRDVPVDGAPEPAGGRGRPLRERDRWVREALETVAAPGAAELWDAACAAPEWADPPVWVHADLDRRNVLVRDGRLAAVLDWGGAGAADPAVDVQAVWKLVGPAERARFRELVGADDATWLRARGWCLSQALIALPYYTPDNNPAIHAEATRWLAEVVRG